MKGAWLRKLAAAWGLTVAVGTTEIRPAAACAACGCGDPTLTAFGTERPFAGRFRASLDGRYRTDTVGQARVDELKLTEARVDAQVAWAPLDRLFLLLTVPTLHRRVEYVNLARRSSTGLGDVEIRGKVFLWQDRDFGPRHSIAVLGGVKLGTAPLQRDAGGKLLPIELQPGTGSHDPLLGLQYAATLDRVSLFASAVGMAPTAGTEGFRASPSVRTTFAAQYSFVPAFGLRAVTDGRLDGKGQEDGAAARDSGGFVLFGGMDALVSPVTDLLFVATVKVPVVQALQGFHREGPLLGLAVAYDF